MNDASVPAHLKDRKPSQPELYVSNSKSIISNQTGIHDKLEAVVRRHLSSPFRRPFPEFSLQAFEQARQWLNTQSATTLIFDSYCGVGESTAALAKQHPEAAIIGLDKSLHRLDKHDEHYSDTNNEKNYLLLRADVDDFWRLAVQAGWKLDYHYLFYPNPWPKSHHLKRRCQGSPLFPSLLQLGGQLELRSNWDLYVKEFAAALNIAGHPAEALEFNPDAPITPFERKYQLAGQTLWRCVCSLN